MSRVIAPHSLLFIREHTRSNNQTQIQILNESHIQGLALNIPPNNSTKSSLTPFNKNTHHFHKILPEARYPQSSDNPMNRQSV